MKKKFSWRAFISFGLFVSFFIIFITGVLLYLAPAGRVAHWVNWKIIGLDKNQWQALHTIFSYVFVILSVFHLFSINWKAFWSYIRSKTSEGLNRSRELYASLALMLFILFGTLWNMVPFSTVMDFGEYLTEMWEETIDNPPVPHAEKLTLVELSYQLEDFDVDKIVARLQNNNIHFDSVTQTLEDIGRLNEIPPADIYNLIVKSSLGGMAGSGMGLKSLETFAADESLNVDTLLLKLRAHDLKAQADQSLKEIANENDMPAKDIYNLLMGEKSQY